MTSLRVGQIVVCVDDTWDYAPLHMSKCPNRPVRGLIYTVRAVMPEDEDEDEDEDEEGILLEDIMNPPAWFRAWFGEPGFYSWRFRPVKRTSIDAFRKIVEPVPAE
jgi:hypothetical protein